MIVLALVNPFAKVGDRGMQPGCNYPVYILSPEKCGYLCKSGRGTHTQGVPSVLVVEGTRCGVFFFREEVVGVRCGEAGVCASV